MARMEMDAFAASVAAPTEASAEACYQLGLMHAAGRSGAVDLVAAQAWFSVALARGCRRAAAHRAELAAELTADQRAEALRRARRMLTLH